MSDMRPEGKKQEAPVQRDDPWANRITGMICATCIYFVKKNGKPGTLVLGRCRRHAPTMNGYPVVYTKDWCGDHKVDENK